MITGELEITLRGISEDLLGVIEAITGFQNLLGVKEDLKIRTELINARNKLGSIIMSLTNETKITDEKHKRLLSESFESVEHVKRELYWILNSVGAQENSLTESDLGIIIRKLHKLKD
jgi:hypothetical protein